MEMDGSKEIKMAYLGFIGFGAIALGLTFVHPVMAFVAGSLSFVCLMCTKD